MYRNVEIYVRLFCVVDEELILFLFCSNLGPFGPLGPLQNREGQNKGG